MAKAAEDPWVAVGSEALLGRKETEYCIAVEALRWMKGESEAGNECLIYQGLTK
jgi:hypothetical protein